MNSANGAAPARPGGPTRLPAQGSRLPPAGAPRATGVQPPPRPPSRLPPPAGESQQQPTGRAAVGGGPPTRLPPQDSPRASNGTVPHANSPAPSTSSSSAVAPPLNSRPPPSLPLSKDPNALANALTNKALELFHHQLLSTPEAETPSFHPLASADPDAARYIEMQQQAAKEARRKLQVQKQAFSTDLVALLTAIPSNLVAQIPRLEAAAQQLPALEALLARGTEQLEAASRREQSRTDGIQQLKDEFKALLEAQRTSLETEFKQALGSVTTQLTEHRSRLDAEKKALVQELEAKQKALVQELEEERQARQTDAAAAQKERDLLEQRFEQRLLALETRVPPPPPPPAAPVVDEELKAAIGKTDQNVANLAMAVGFPLPRPRKRPRLDAEEDEKDDDESDRAAKVTKEDTEGKEEEESASGTTETILDRVRAVEDGIKRVANERLEDLSQSSLVASQISSLESSVSNLEARPVPEPPVDPSSTLHPEQLFEYIKRTESTVVAHDNNFSQMAQTIAAREHIVDSKISQLEVKVDSLDKTNGDMVTVFDFLHDALPAVITEVVASATERSVRTGQPVALALAAAANGRAVPPTPPEDR